MRVLIIVNYVLMFMPFRMGHVGMEIPVKTSDWLELGICEAFLYKHWIYWAIIYIQHAIPSCWGDPGTGTEPSCCSTSFSWRLFCSGIHWCLSPVSDSYRLISTFGFSQSINLQHTISQHFLWPTMVLKLYTQSACFLKYYACGTLIILHGYSWLIGRMYLLCACMTHYVKSDSLDH